MRSFTWLGPLAILAALACSGTEEVSICDAAAPNPTPCTNPVILVPGLGASILDVLYEDSYQPIHDVCQPLQRNQWSTGVLRLWPALGDAFPDAVSELREVKECRLDDLAVRFDPETRTFSNAPGLQVRPRGWGCTDGISNLFRFTLKGRILVHPTASSVYEELIERLTHDHGYVVGQSLRGAPYDFRLVADDTYLRHYFADLKKLVEETYEKTAGCASGPKRVFLMGHSLGVSVTLYFLNTYVDAAWKEKYIRAFLTVGGPWTGSPKAYRALLSGDREGRPGENLEFLTAERLMGGLLWMAPWVGAQATTPFVSLEGVEYGATLEDFETLFGQVAGRSQQALILKEIIAPRARAVGDPGVMVACLHGSGLPTEAHFIYEGKGFDRDPVVDRHVSGDGTVTLDVLEHCTQWQNVVHRDFEGGEHLGLLHEKRFVDYVSMLLTDCWSEQRTGPPNAKCPEIATQ